MPSSSLPTPPCAYLKHPFSSSFYIATYNNDETTNTKSGHMFKFDSEFTIQDEAFFDDEGVLALSLFKGEEDFILAAGSSGNLIFLSLSLKILSKIEVSDKALTDVRASVESKIITADLNGVVTVIEDDEITSTFKACTYPGPGNIPAECWSLDFYTDKMLTGGENMKLTIWNYEGSKLSEYKEFDAGVTLIKVIDSVVHVGSYDDIYRQFIIKDDKFELLRTCKMPGGIWRIEINSDEEIALACMYGGAVVLKEEEGNMED